MNSRKSRGSSRKSSKNKSERSVVPREQPEDFGRSVQQYPIPGSYSPDSRYYASQPMYAQYPAAVPGQFLAAPGQYISPHMQFGQQAAADGMGAPQSMNYFAGAGQMSGMVPSSYPPQYGSDISGQQALSAQQQAAAAAAADLRNQQFLQAHGYLPTGGSHPGNGLSNFQIEAMAQAAGLQNMLNAPSDPHLVNKGRWAMMGNQMQMMHHPGAQSLLNAQQSGQTVSIEENVEKQIDKLSSRRPKRARRANYNLKPIVPELTSSVGSLAKQPAAKPSSHKSSAPSDKSRPEKARETDDAQQQPNKASTASGTGAKPKTIAPGSSEEEADGDNKGKKKRKRNPETTSHYRGVSWNKANKSWKACIKVKGKNIHIGYFGDDVDAAKAYDMIAQQYRGSSAKVNFPESRVEFSRAVHSNLE